MGGGVFSNGGSLVLTNDTFTADTAAGGAGAGSAGEGLGGASSANGSLTATFDTFSGNTAAQGGTDVYVLSDSNSGSGFTGGTATATLVNDILGQASAPVPDFVANQIGTAAAPTLTGSSNDFVSNNTAAATYPGTESLPTVAVVNGGVTDPQLSALAPNGGPTQTMALAATSPAALAGVDVPGLTTDQRGQGAAYARSGRRRDHPLLHDHGQQHLRHAGQRRQRGGADEGTTNDVLGATVTLAMR